MAFQLQSVSDAYTMAAFGQTRFRSENPKLAIFDIDGTLIRPKGKTVFPKSLDDWKWLTEDVPARLRALHDDDGYDLVFITNQKKMSGSDITTKAGMLYSDLGVPFVLVSGHAEPYYRKPHTGLWKLITNQLCPQLKKKDCFFVGDMDTDEAFAHNVGLKFKWAWAYWGLPAVAVTPYVHPLEGIIGVGEKTYARRGVSQHLLVLVGPPASGKSSIARRLHTEFQYTIINQDTLKTPAKQRSAFAKALEAGSSIVIDNTNPLPDSRGQWIEPARAAGYFVTIVFIDISKAAAEYLNAYRHEVSDGEAKYIPSVAYNVYYAKLVKPIREIDEADEIVTETQVWVKDEAARRKLMSMWF